MFKKYYRLGLILASLMVLCVTLYGFLSPWLFMGDMFVNLRPRYLQAGFLIFALGALSRSKPVFWLALVGIVLNGSQILPYWVPVARPAESNLSIITYNANRDRVSQQGPQQIIDLVAYNQPDVAVLLEIGAPASREIKQRFAADYPYSTVLFDSFEDGTLLLSKFPLENQHTHQYEGGRTFLYIDIAHPNDAVHLIAAHPINPFENMRLRNRQLSGIADYVQTVDGPVVLAGDLNVTLWSSWYKRLEQAGLINVRQGYGVMPTWKIPEVPFRYRLVHLPLDHILVNGELDIFSADILPNFGSDHAPVRADLFVPGRR